MDREDLKTSQECVCERVCAQALQMLLIRKSSLEKHTHWLYWLYEDLVLTSSPSVPHISHQKDTFGPF